MSRGVPLVCVVKDKCLRLDNPSVNCVDSSLYTKEPMVAVCLGEGFSPWRFYYEEKECINKFIIVIVCVDVI